jgi:hypothetical protein
MSSINISGNLPFPLSANRRDRNADKSGSNDRRARCEKKLSPVPWTQPHK